ncbi:G-protein coupled receptor Mth2-like [Bactrocera oleae]|uniref:G-protein coupled receptor Mth2-like n=1 Tax=Bactrocera oleae TaxID=104688 RepID=UPI00387E8FEE
MRIRCEVIRFHCKNLSVFYGRFLKIFEFYLSTMTTSPLTSSNVFYILLSIVHIHFTIAEIPHCPFEDTVNITGSQILPNGSYNNEGLAVPPHLTGYYEYIELFGGKRDVVAKHLRGCVCQLKRCVKFCCHPRADIYRSTENLRVECDDQLNEELTYSPYLNITLNNGNRIPMHVVNEFVVQQGLPCDLGYMLMPHLREEHQWELFENGSLLRVGDRLLISRRDYCLTAYPVGNRFVINPMNCDAGQKSSANIMLNTIIMLISLPFLYATILIFWLIPGLRNLHTKCLLSYLFSLAIGNTMIIAINLRKSDYDKAVCAAMGFITYYFLSAVFFWLNVICFDMYQNFHGTKGNIQHLTQRKQIIYYSIYAWGMPAMMTAITVTLQYSDLSDVLKSGIGVTHCWLKSNDWSAMMYFHGPCLLLIAINIVIFYVTV